MTQQSTVYNGLITSLITLKVILGDIIKTNKLKELEMNNNLKNCWKKELMN